MRSTVLRDGKLVVRHDVAEPVPGAGQVLVEVKACGICGSDLHFARHGATMGELSGRMRGIRDPTTRVNRGTGPTWTATCSWDTSSPPRCSKRVPTRRRRPPARSSPPSPSS